MKSAVIVWSGADTGTSANLFKALEKALAKHIQTRACSNPLVGGSMLAKAFGNLRSNVSRIPLVLKSDCVIVHSYASLSLISMLAARLARRDVYVFNWDVYPTTINGEGRKGVFRRLADKLEPFAIRLATHVVVPTKDFLPFVSHPNLIELPLWPSLEPKPFQGSNSTDVVKVAFAGQIDPSRGLPQAIKAICRMTEKRVEFHVFSSGAELPSQEMTDVSGNYEIVYYPSMSRSEMQDKLTSMNFGLISLHPKFDQPGYPSKVFDYIAANLPVLYFGRPLPSFTKEIEDAGVGVVLDGASADLAHLYAELIDSWETKRDQYLGRVSLNDDKLSSIFNIEVPSLPSQVQA